MHVFAKALLLIIATTLGIGMDARATSCGWSGAMISEVITDKTVVFRGKPIYFSQKTRPGARYGWSTVFKIDELYKGSVGDYGNFVKVYHHRQFYQWPYQIGEPYFIVAQRQDNGDFVKEGIDLCPSSYSEPDILEFIKTGNPEAAVPWSCYREIKRGIQAEFLIGELTLYDKRCLRFVPAFENKYPKFTSKYRKTK